MTITKRLYLVAGLVAILVIAFSAVTLTSRLTSAQGGTDATGDSAACEQEDEADDAAEAGVQETDTDNIEQECGDQNEGDNEAGDVQEPQLNGSIAVDEEQSGGLSEADEAAALAPLATISEDEAIAAAQAEVPGTVDEVELEDENGSLVYSVDIGSRDVKVDAGTGAVLHIDSD